MAKVIFLHLFVILFTGGGCLSQCMLGYHSPLGADIPPEADTPCSRHPPGADTPLGADLPRSKHPLRSRHPSEQTPPRADTSPQSRHHPEADPPGADTPPASRLRHTVNERPVRILLECVLLVVVCKQPCLSLSFTQESSLADFNC